MADDNDDLDFAGDWYFVDPIEVERVLGALSELSDTVEDADILASLDNACEEIADLVEWVEEDDDLDDDI